MIIQIQEKLFDVQEQMSNFKNSDVVGNVTVGRRQDISASF